MGLLEEQAVFDLYQHSTHTNAAMGISSLEVFVLTHGIKIWSWRDGSVVKSTDCFSRGPEFNSQQPHDSSQPSVMGSGVLFWCV